MKTISSACSTAILIAAFLLGACKSSKESASAQTNEQTSTPSKKVTLLPIATSAESKGTDTFEIVRTHINGDTLFAEVTYSGGCKDHIFSARRDSNIMKSMPPQLNITIEHQSNGDGCRELIQQTLAFDLTNCRTSNSKSIVLIVNGNRSGKITYAY